MSYPALNVICEAPELALTGQNLNRMRHQPRVVSLRYVMVKLDDVAALSVIAVNAGIVLPFPFGSNVLCNLTA